RLPPGLEDALRDFLPEAGRPLIARSSSLLEDARDVPFSGIYESYAIPNSHPDPALRLGQLCSAVKLVYASLYSPGAETYREAAGCPDEAEEMAVLVQELVGSRRGRWFYPLLSGTAQSYNYYPISHARAEDGLCEAALGLGSYVVDGGAVHRFCPRWPYMDAVPPELAGDGSQVAFRALDMENPEPDLAKGESAAVAELAIAEAEGWGALDLVASTWDREDRRLVPGALRDGPRIVDLSPILKYDALPLAPAMAAALEACESATGGPVELEFALDAGPKGADPTLYLLQLKRLRRTSGSGIELSEEDEKGCFIVSERAMGDGRIDGIRDVLWIDPAAYDRSRSRETAEEVAALDRELGALGRPYILIGPGRWGSRDPWLGVPVEYPHIAHAAVIVETELPGFATDFSFGSHFLRNVAGRGIGYLSVAARGRSALDWEFLRSRNRERQLSRCARSRLEAPLEVLMDGLRGRAIVRAARPRAARAT
ncbi:MAG: PEP/pyruvate-binding domain-containing protein, partial [Spirochaetaceae bacterium]|nr:PEP/pyruvate-binding domain-containing protein [Spirochaetaceae bacterium]